jgi:hypothetical protein
MAPRAHAQLARGFDAAIHERLVRSNWSRTIGWTVLRLLDIWMLVQHLAS